MEYKICPILKAGTMLTSIGTRSQHGIQGDANFTATVSSEAAKCIGIKCQWFKRGCPAFPISDGLRGKIDRIVSKSS